MKLTPPNWLADERHNIGIPPSPLKIIIKNNALLILYQLQSIFKDLSNFPTPPKRSSAQGIPTNVT